MKNTKTTLAQMLLGSIDRCMMEDLKTYRSGSVGEEQNFVVINHEHADAYTVEVEDGIIQGCTCPHATHRKTICKHQLKVALTHNMDIAQLKKEA